MARPIILTVDDDVAVSQAIRRDLRSRYGDRYRIVRATSGAEALATLEELAQRDLRVALIVSDHRMPEMTGIELLKAIRADDRYKTLPVLMVTAEAKREQIIEAAQNGVNGYIIKPFTAQTLEEKLGKIFERLGAAA